MTSAPHVSLYESLDAADIALERALAAAKATPDEPAPFSIENEEQALWAARKLRHARQEIADRQQLAEREIQRITEWLEQANATAAATADYFEALLTDFHRRVLADDPKRKTVQLPGVTLKARKQPLQWQFDDDAFIAWAKASAADLELVRTKEEVNKVEAKARLTVDGETVMTPDGTVADGVSVAEGEVKFTVAVEADA